MRLVDHSDEGFILLVKLYWTDLDIVLSLHVPEERPHVLQRLFGAFSLQPKTFEAQLQKKSQKSKVMSTHKHHFEF